MIRKPAGLNTVSVVTQTQNKGVDNMDIGSRREVCWDEAMIDTAEHIRVQMHRPEYRNEVLTCDACWEGNDSAVYFSLTQAENCYRMYYRGFSVQYHADGTTEIDHQPVWCLAESSDGRSFHRVPLNLESFCGTKENNIVPFPEDALRRGSVFIFRDTNPACPPDERYKALAELTDQTLCYFKSADGIDFQQVRVLADDGAYDSLNVALWDAQSQQYFLFYRGIHGSDSENGKWKRSAAKLPHNDNIVRDIRVRTSKDFVQWDTPRMIEFQPERDDVDLYINNIQKYYRADHMFLGMPVRYVDRYRDAVNIPQLPGWPFRQSMMRVLEREGTAVTDALVMTSRDGYSFRRTEEAFFTPGTDRGTNWIYGDCYFCYGMAETPSDIPGAPNEISLYVGNDYHAKPVTICRYALRLDGFFSWRCDYTPGTLLTKPFVFDGNALTLNFATSCAGYVRIQLTDADGALLDGYDSGFLFGDSVERQVCFTKPLEELSGKEVRMKLSMKDADLYSFRFYRD